MTDVSMGDTIRMKLVSFGDSHYTPGYWVSPTGAATWAASYSSAPLSGTDCCSLATANTNAAAGAIVYIRAGTYTRHTHITSANNGTSDNYTIFKSYANEDVILQTTTTDYPIEMRDLSYDVISYVKFDGSGNDGGTHLRITTTASDRCIIFQNCQYIWLTHLEVDSAVNNDCIKITGVAPETEPDDDKGSKDCLVEYCKIHDGGDYGIKLTGYGTDRNIIRYNKIYSNGKAGYGASRYGINLSGSGYETNPPDANEFYGNNIYANYASGISINTATNTVFRDNEVYNNGTGGSGGRGIGLSYATSGSRIYNNIVYGNSYYGIECSTSGSATAHIYNNVVYHNLGGDAEIRIQTSTQYVELYNNTVYCYDHSSTNVISISSTCSNITLKNNIAISTGATNSYGFRCDTTTGIVAYNNNFWTSGTTGGPVYLDGTHRTIAWMNDTWTGDAADNISEDPAWDANYRLTSSTPSGSGHTRDGALDLTAEGFTADKDGIARPAGQWDMGAYEYEA